MTCIGSIYFLRGCDLRTPISTRSLQVIAKFCGHLRVLRVLCEDYTPEEAYEWDTALEAVLRGNPMLHANDGLGYHYLTKASMRYAIRFRVDAFEPTEGSKYAELSPFAARLSSSIVSCRNDPARVTRVLDTAVRAADFIYRLRIPVRDRWFEDWCEAAHAFVLDAALVRGEANS